MSRLGHITGKCIIGLYLGTDTIRFRTDLRPDGSQLQFQSFLRVLWGSGIICGPVSFLQLDPVDDGGISEGSACRLAVDQDVGVVRIIIRGRAGSVLGDKRCFKGLPGSSCQVDSRQRFASVRYPDSDGRQAAFRGYP